MQRKTRLRMYYTILAILCIPIGLFSKTLSGWIAANLGGAIYVMFWGFAVLAVFPQLSPMKVALWTFAATCAVEFLQLWQPPFLQDIRATRAGRLLLGNTFSWKDFPYYFLGAVGIVLLGLER